jgi:hypothetical protein
MATSYGRLSGWWGEIEAYKTDEQVFATSERQALGDDAETPNTAVRRAQLVFNRTGSGSGEDVATCSMDFMNMTSGDLDDTWNDTDFNTMTGLITTFITAYAPLMFSSTVLDQVRWYRVGPGIVPPNPPVNIQDVNVAGSNASPMPPQIAISVTERCAVRKCWGRFYLPSPGQSAISSSRGEITSTAVTSIADAADALYSAAYAADFIPVVWAKTRNKVFTVEKLQVDSLFDVIRSRRWDRPTTKVVRDASS